MTRRQQFALILLSTVALASLASHAVYHVLGIEPIISFLDFGAEFHSTPMLAAGSSLVNYGIQWDSVASEFSRPVKLLTTPAASACELEVLQARAPKSDFTVLGISESDMDETVIADIRPELVSFSRTWRDLRESRAEGALIRRTMSKYPLRDIRILFPMAGRSMGLMVGFRKIWRDFRSRHAASESEPLPTFDTKGNWPTNRISDWDTGRRLRNVEVTRQLSGGVHSFSGPKHLALERMLRYATSTGKAVVVVMPESPLYAKEVIDPSATQAFETSVADMARRVPAAKWIRMDQVADLQTDTLYWDLVHLNADGRPLATAALIEQLKPIVLNP
jgi:hypothetical protein